MLCDSNILIYAAEPGDAVCAPYVERAEAVIASVTRIEVLGFPGFAALSAERQARLREVVNSLLEAALDGPWTDLPEAANPYVIPPSGTNGFYRLRQ